MPWGGVRIDAVPRRDPQGTGGGAVAECREKRSGMIRSAARRWVPRPKNHPGMRRSPVRRERNTRFVFTNKLVDKTSSGR